MIYFANPCGDDVRQAMVDGRLGCIDTPCQRKTRPRDITWCADNGCFGKEYPGDWGWSNWLVRNSDSASRCIFATAPDVVGDAVATIERSVPLLAGIRKLGYSAAFVGQDGLEALTVPWDSFDAFFIGGSTEWKLGEAARGLAVEARARGKWVHMGRVNSRKRFQLASAFCDSVDGTYLTFGPRINLPKLLSWIEEE